MTLEHRLERLERATGETATRCDCPVVYGRIVIAGRDDANTEPQFDNCPTCGRLRELGKVVITERIVTAT